MLYVLIVRLVRSTTLLKLTIAQQTNVLIAVQATQLLLQQPLAQMPRLRVYVTLAMVERAMLLLVRNVLLDHTRLVRGIVIVLRVRQVSTCLLVGTFLA